MTNMNHTILAIETSCDETAASVYTSTAGVLSNIIYSQVDLHQAYGGVVPEIASRSHIEKIPVIVEEALQKANIALTAINTIAVTTKPGLPGSLLMGLCFAKGLAWSSKKNVIGVDHLEGHIFSACIDNNITFPFLCLTASGGHTALYYVTGFGQYTLLGQTLDDAAGEAFDKVSKLLDLGYPGGPQIEQYAQAAEFQDFFAYPRALSNSFNFSFSGLKTAVLYHLKNNNWYNTQAKKLTNYITTEIKQQVASSLLVAISQTFVSKIQKALNTYPELTSVAFVGGVAANKYIRNQLKKTCEQNHKKFYVPAFEYCTDNAAMIAFVAHYKAQRKQYDTFKLDIY